MDNEELRVAVYRAFSEGRVPTVAGLAHELNALQDSVRTGLFSLANARHLVLRGADIVLAHPFASESFGFSVMGRDRLWYGGCSWDSFAIAHLLPKHGPMLIATTCPACGAPHAWNVDNHEPPPGDQIAHFLIPVNRMWEDVVHTCSNQRIFCSEDCLDTWLEVTENERGHVMDLATLWRLASRWYEGRLEHGYRRREPTEAANYFRSVGLDGPFWVL